MSLFEKIICPIDFSDASVRALQWVQSLAAKFHSRVIVLYVMHSYSAKVEAAGEQFPTQITDSMREFLAPLEIEYEILLSSGEPWQKITALSQGLDATLIVMSTRGLTGPRHKILGSTTENVVRTSTVPVVTLSPECTAPPVTAAGNVLFPISTLDGPPENYMSLRNVIREVATSVCLLHVVDAGEAAVAGGEPAGAGWLRGANVQEWSADSAKKDLLRIGGLLVRDGAEAVIQAGSPGLEILKEIDSGRHDYVLLNVKKAGPLSRFMESTVYKVISQSRIPVFSICREG